MDGYLYAIILFPAMSDLLGTTESAVIGWYGGIVLSIFMIGWALGGLVFGPIADRYGRARTMAITILLYASFTVLCAIAGNWQELAIYRFLTGLGIGGEWAAGAALIAESFPEKSRAKAAGIMQASGGIGFFLPRDSIFLLAPTAGAGFSRLVFSPLSSPSTSDVRWRNPIVGAERSKRVIRLRPDGSRGAA
jgi:MFS family permease